MIRHLVLVALCAGCAGPALAQSAVAESPLAQSAVAESPSAQSATAESPLAQSAVAESASAQSATAETPLAHSAIPQSAVAQSAVAQRVPAATPRTSSARRSCGASSSWSSLFTGTVSSFQHLPSRETAQILGIGAAAALGAHAADASTLDEVSESSSLRGSFRPGATIGGTPFLMGAAITAYSIGRATNNPCTANVGADLFRAQLMAQALTMAVKAVAQRPRPEGSGYSFPSGHTTVSFATATVLQRHFGWKVGLPAYAAASYVAASRVEMKRHYLSDVAFGAALGIVAGRTVTVGIGGRHLLLSPMATAGGAGASFTWLGKSSQVP